MSVFQGMRLSLVLAAVICAAGGGLARQAHAAAPPENFLLGTSTETADVCEAVADDEDPVAQRKGAYAWSVRCRGWTHEVGRLYAFTNGGGEEVGQGGAWTVALDRRATCQAGLSTTVVGLDQATEYQCRTSSGADYVAYRARAVNRLRPTVTATAEGLKQFSGLLQIGLRTVAGRVGTVAAAPITVRDSGEESSAKATPEQIRNASYNDNQRWNFERALKGFRAIAQDRTTSPARRADAYLNWALNLSDEGRFKEAEDRFRDAEQLLAGLRNTDLDALDLNYRALHERNMGRFEEAIASARKAIELRASIVKNGPVVGAASTEISITEGLSTALNHGVELNSLQSLTDDEKRAVRDAQAWYVIGSAQERLGKVDEARASLAKANRIFETLREQPEARLLFASTGWLQGQILAEMSRVSAAKGKDPTAVDAAKAALFALRRQPNMTGSDSEAAFLFYLAQAEAANGQAPQAIRDYQQGFALFRNNRDSLGASADEAEGYFDLLIQQAHDDPAQAAKYQALYFEAMQSVVDATTADTMKALFARISTGDSEAAILARNFEETKSRLQAADGAIAALQDANRYAGVEKERADAEAAALRVQLTKIEDQLAIKNPHYKAIVRSDATMAQLQRALKPGEVYVKILILNEKGFGLAVSPDRVATYAIPLSSSDAISAVDDLRYAFKENEYAAVLPYNVIAAHTLYAQLFGPVADTVAKARHLIYEPDSRLIGLPAEILVTDQASADAFQARYAKNDHKINLYENVSWLGRKTDVSLEVGAAAFIQSRQSVPAKGSTKAFIGFGDPLTENVQDARLFSRVLNPELGMDRCEKERQDMIRQLKRLPGADAAIRQIAGKFHAPPTDIVVGEAFTDQAVETRADLKDYRVIFFGTHGLLPVAGDCIPGPALVTSLGSGESDGLLGLNQISQLDLGAAELVVLSACNTGGGKAETGVAGSGAALDGLARAFISVGARNLIVSHWQIPAESNLLIMTSIFTPGSDDQAEALGRAQRALMDQEQYSHPFYWAAFSLVGDGAKLMPPPDQAILSLKDVRVLADTGA